MKSIFSFVIQIISNTWIHSSTRWQAIYWKTSKISWRTRLTRQLTVEILLLKNVKPLNNWSMDVRYESSFLSLFESTTNNRFELSSIKRDTFLVLKRSQKTTMERIVTKIHLLLPTRKAFMYVIFKVMEQVQQCTLYYSISILKHKIISFSYHDVCLSTISKLLISIIFNWYPWWLWVRNLSLSLAIIFNSLDECWASCSESLMRRAVCRMTSDSVNLFHTIANRKQSVST